LLIFFGMAKVEKTEQGVVVLDYADLKAGKDLSASVEEAYGFNGIGLLVVKNVPNFVELRQKLLPLGAQFAKLPDSVKDKVTHKASNYSVGWSHGKEILKPGQYDEHKGSYYANPQYDVPTTDLKLIDEFPESCLPNIWPKDDFPALEPAFKQLGELVVSTGLLVAAQCDKAAKNKLPSYPDGLMVSTIQKSRVAKGRLLHYFPIKDAIERSRDSWCAWHNDHGSLTGLCPAMYQDVRDTSKEIPCPDKEAGLWVRTRQHKEFRVTYPKDFLAFQIGETAQIMSGGVLRATPHAVQAIKYPDSEHVCRNTFAVFMEPNFDVPMTIPAGRTVKDAACERFKEGMTFGEFSKVTISGYYKAD